METCLLTSKLRTWSERVKQAELPSLSPSFSRWQIRGTLLQHPARPRCGVNGIRATYTSYPVSATVPPSTNKDPNRAPWGLGANFIQFDAGSAKGTLRVSFDGADGVAWRAVVVLTPASGQAAASVAVLALDAGGAGSVSISGFGSRWSRATLVPTIAGTAGTEVPFGYGATLE